MKRFEGQFSVSALRRVLLVSRSGYYAWQKRAMSVRQQTNNTLTEKIKVAFEANRQAYGSPRLFRELQEHGIACCVKRLARLMRLSDLKAIVPKRFVVTADSHYLRWSCPPWRRLFLDVVPPLVYYGTPTALNAEPVKMIVANINK